ncbi:Uu.00g039170.m01.CDS01 [Anthostomella pinea]|uniref:Uu.00g039170.m01.CDS01 n=1 Tax=Anthostomella pinea TaxID=933095 RepID=A0AAI8V9Y3_9PEZI|nr:Uu.00g039170.m01.CDS01 [Anthostomella pinea]
MAQQQNQTSSGVSEVTVDTCNFPQILEHFDDHTRLINPGTTRLAIPCYICQHKDLAILNSRFDTYSRATHELYAVLPRCGHLFGAVCIYDWLIRGTDPRNPTCPVCRASIFCGGNHIAALEIYGPTVADEQTEEIAQIRHALVNITCPRCPPETPDIMMIDTESLDLGARVQLLEEEERQLLQERNHIREELMEWTDERGAFLADPNRAEEDIASRLEAW